MDKIPAQEALNKIPEALHNIAKQGNDWRMLHNYILNLIMTIENDEGYMKEKIGQLFAQKGIKHFEWKVCHTNNSLKN